MKNFITRTQFSTKLAFSILTLTCLTLACKQGAYLPTSNHQMVVSTHPEASNIGYEILKEGGNAFDAAIAVQFALAVVYPRAGNIGGGGFAVFHESNGKNGALDFREVAPFSAYPRLYYDERGRVNTEASLTGSYAVGVPGSVDGMWKMHLKKGKLSWKALVQPAIDLARKGVKLTEMEANHMNEYAHIIDSVSLSPTVFNSKHWKPGDLFIQSDLAHTLELIRDKGRDGFYQGETADKIIKTIKIKHGIMRHYDLFHYNAVWRDALKGYYRDYTIITMPPPSAGGVMLLQMLFGAEFLNLDQMGQNSTAYLHNLIEIQRRTYADRAQFFGDPDYNFVPVDKLLSPLFLEKKFKDIGPKATPSSAIKPTTEVSIESFETTHFSVVDRYGNAVSVTTTLNGNYGSKLVVDHAGFLLNNEMNDFTIEIGKANQFGMIGGKMNEIIGGKRMLSNMTPTIILKNKDLFAVLGTPGGSTIPTVVMQAAMNIMSFKMSMQQSVSSPKIHSQWLPDEVYYEQELSPAVVDSLKQLGHAMYYKPLGKLNCILRLPDGSLQGGTDRIKTDGAIVGD